MVGSERLNGAKTEGINTGRRHRTCMSFMAGCRLAQFCHATTGNCQTFPGHVIIRTSTVEMGQPISHAEHCAWVTNWLVSVAEVVLRDIKKAFALLRPT